MIWNETIFIRNYRYQYSYSQVEPCKLSLFTDSWKSLSVPTLMVIWLVLLVNVGNIFLCNRRTVLYYFFMEISHWCLVFRQHCGIYELLWHLWVKKESKNQRYDKMNGKMCITYTSDLFRSKGVFLGVDNKVSGMPCSFTQVWYLKQLQTRGQRPNESQKAVKIDMMKSVGEIASNIWPVV